METKKIRNIIGLTLFSCLLVLLTMFTNGYAQKVDMNNVDDEQDLFDENTDYKEMFKDISNDGEWIQMTRAELEEQTSATDDGNGQGYSSTNEQMHRNIWIWRPHKYRMHNNWAPYSNGRWYYTEDDEWYWDPDYDYGWGWATYHYGRWVFSPYYGWIWIPGRYWAMSWVEWCYYDNYVGWYPRCPRYHHGYDYNRYYENHRRRWVVVEKEKIREKIKDNDRVKITQNDEIINGSRIKSNGPISSVTDNTNGNRIDKKKVVFTDDKSSTKVDGNTIDIYRPDAKDTKKNVTIDKKNDQTRSDNQKNNNSDVNRNNNANTQKDKDVNSNISKENNRDNEKVKKDNRDNEKAKKDNRDNEKVKDTQSNEKPKKEKSPDVQKPRTEKPKDDSSRKSKETYKTERGSNSDRGSKSSDRGSRSSDRGGKSNNSGKSNNGSKRSK